VAALEVLLRLNGYGNLEIYQPDPVLYWKLKPNQDCRTKIDLRPVHINSLGTRGPEFQVVKPPDTIRILSLGDSRTFGWGLREAETYSTRLQQLLQQEFGPSKQVEVINAGVNAWSYSQMLAYFRDTALSYRPDVVIVAEANLWTQFSEHNSPEFVKKFMSRVRLKNFLRRFATYHYFVEIKLKAFYERHRTRFIPVDPSQDTLFKEQQQADPDAVFRSALQDIVGLAKTNRVQPVLLFLPTEDELITTNTSSSRILQAKGDLSRSHDVPLVDITRDVCAETNAVYLEGDPVHFNSRGNEIIARQLFRTILPMINR
jgi:lysophospholipase L1-like esterase